MSAPLEMNPEIRARWTATLRSGKVRQARNSLRTDRGGRCCLGVLCDLAVADGVILAATRDEDGTWHYDGESDHLPERVWEWAGLDSDNPTVRGDLRSLSLTFLNDTMRWTFALIADAIDGTDPAEVTQ